MEVIREWAVGLGAACIISAVIKFLLPKGGISKAVRFTVVIFTLIIFLQPLTDITIDFKDYVTGIDEMVNSKNIETELENQIADSLEKQITSEISAYLIEADIEYQKINADINIDINKNILIECIEIFIPFNSALYEEKIIMFVKEKFGLNPDIIIGEIVNE